MQHEDPRIGGRKPDGNPSPCTGLVQSLKLSELSVSTPELGKITIRGAVCAVGCSVCGSTTAVHTCGWMWYFQQTFAGPPLSERPSSRRDCSVGAGADARGSVVAVIGAGPSLCAVGQTAAGGRRVCRQQVAGCALSASLSGFQPTRAHRGSLGESLGEPVPVRDIFPTCEKWAEHLRVEKFLLAEGDSPAIKGVLRPGRKDDSAWKTRTPVGCHGVT